jgi:hypothetical protein
MPGIYEQKKLGRDTQEGQVRKVVQRGLHASLPPCWHLDLMGSHSKFLFFRPLHYKTSTVDLELSGALKSVF